jgi:hypothetical protein
VLVAVSAGDWVCAQAQLRTLKEMAMIAIKITTGVLGNMQHLIAFWELDRYLLVW